LCAYRKKVVFSDALYTDIRFCVVDLAPGFDVVSDYSECNVLHHDYIPVLKEIMSYLMEYGLGETVRLIKNEQISYKQILNLGVRIEGYNPIYVSNLNEVDSKLEAAIRRNGVRINLHQVQIEYKKDTQTQQGRVINMSTIGCSVKHEPSSADLNIDAEIALQVLFRQESEKAESFSIKARVVRVEKDSFAAEFIDLEDDAREQIWNCLLTETRS
jgi:PilZ domain